MSMINNKRVCEKDLGSLRGFLKHSGGDMRVPGIRDLGRRCMGECGNMGAYHRPMPHAEQLTTHGVVFVDGMWRWVRKGGREDEVELGGGDGGALD